VASHRIPTEAVAEDATFDEELAQLRQERLLAAGPERAGPAEARPPASAVHGRVRVLTGPSAGRVVDIERDAFVIGRVGVQVAAIERHDGVLRLVPREGDGAPTVNGAPVPREGLTITPGDTLEIAGTALELVSEK
jgi:hypothetical protein